MSKIHRRVECEFKDKEKTIVHTANWFDNQYVYHSLTNIDT